MSDSETLQCDMCSEPPVGARVRPDGTFVQYCEDHRSQLVNPEPRFYIGSGDTDGKNAIWQIMDRTTREPYIMVRIPGGSDMNRLYMILVMLNEKAHMLP